MSGRGVGVAQEWEWTAPEDRETKTIVVAVFHWRQSLQKAARANRGQYKQENRAGANRQTEKECKREGESGGGREGERQGAPSLWTTLITPWD